jgi:hypothetical protein
LTRNRALQLRLGEIVNALKETVDVSLLIKEQEPELEKDVILLWEKFSKDFIDYVQIRGRETGQNLLNGISLPKITLELLGHPRGIFNTLKNPGIQTLKA